MSETNTTASVDTEVISDELAAFERFVPLAMALPANELVPFRVDVALAHYNLVRGVAAVRARRSEVERLPGINLAELEELPELSLALHFAARQVDRRSDADRAPLDELMEEARGLRRLLLLAAEALAAAGVVLAKEVALIREGRGGFDAASDCLHLAVFFEKHAAVIRGKSPVTVAQARRASELGAQLLARLRPAGASRKFVLPDSVKNAIDARDRLWSLLVKRHRELRRVGMWLWCEEVDAHVPGLQARGAARRSRTGARPRRPQPR